MVRYQIVHARVSPGRRSAYLEAWAEWSGATLPMGIETRLLEREDAPGEFVEITRLGAAAAALGDDRLVRLEAELDVAAEVREGSLRLYKEVRPPSPGT